MARHKKEINEAFTQPFAVNLRTLMEREPKTSQTELARAIVKSRQVVSQYCTGISEPPYEILVKIAKYFNVSLDYLLGITEDKKLVPSVIDELGLTEEAVNAITSAAASETIGQLNLLLAHHDLPAILKMLHKVSRAVTAELSHLKNLTVTGEKGAYFENLDTPGNKVNIADLGNLGLHLATEYETETIKKQILETYPELQDRIIIEYGREAIARHIETISSLFKYLVWDTTHYSDLDNFYADMWRQNNSGD